MMAYIPMSVWHGTVTISLSFHLISGMASLSANGKLAPWNASRHRNDQKMTKGQVSCYRLF
jgi:hypothetical protein